MANLRFEVVAEAFKKRPVEVKTPKVRPSEYFAKYVFNRQKMYKYLPSDVYEKLIDVIDNGTRLDRSIADVSLVNQLEVCAVGIEQELVILRIRDAQAVFIQRYSPG